MIKRYLLDNFLILILTVTLTVFHNGKEVIGSPPLQLGPQVGFNDFRDEPITRSSRISRSVIPSNYQLEIRPILESSNEAEAFKAPGKVRIQVKCIEATNSIELHSLDTVIDQAGVTVSHISGTPTLTLTSHEFNTTKQTYKINLGSSLVENEEYFIEIPFVSNVSDGYDGLYKSSYQTAEGVKRYLATTQFQEVGARKAFPCFDEPDLKATFDVKIGRSIEGGYHSLFCTVPIGEPQPIDNLPGWVWDVYDTTLYMPTYLLAIIVSDFTSETAPPGLYHKPIKTWGPPPMMAEEDSAKFSAQSVAKIISFFEKYFEITYDMPKMDSVAVPDFAAGAMENWGLNTYRIPVMLFFKGESTQFEQWRQAAVIAHELAHQWFGNLVTLQWWNDLWLNEGFARYLQFIAVNDTEPQFESMNRVVLDTIQLAMDFDAGASSAPVHSNDTDEIAFPPSRIAYEKGASLIRMMNGFLTESTLMKGLKSYLRNNAYKNTVQDQLFAELQAAAEADGRLPDGVTVKDIMDTWTFQTGFPVIKISKATATRIFISQEKFLTPENSNMNSNGLWYVPVTYATKSNPNFSQENWTPKLWLDKTTLLTSFSVPSTYEWIVVNPDVRSYYRVQYDNHFTTLLKEQLDTDHNVISESSRSQLLDDYFKLAFANYIPISRALDFTTYLNKEERLVVWTAVLNALRQTYTLLRDTPQYEKFKTYFLSKIKVPLESIGTEQLENENPLTSMLRTQLLDWACGMGHELCYSTSKRLIQRWMDNPNVNPIAADIQPMIYCGAVASAEDDSVSNFMKERHGDENRSEREKTLLLNALACSSSLTDLRSYLELALDEPSRFGWPLIQKIAENSIAHNEVYEFLSTRKNEILEKVGPSGISYPISAMSQYLSSALHITELEKFIDENDDLPEEHFNRLRNSLEVVQKNKMWRDNHLEGISEWLDQQ